MNASLFLFSSPLKYIIKNDNITYFNKKYLNLRFIYPKTLYITAYQHLYGLNSAINMHTMIVSSATDIEIWQQRT